jgi:hypothetical protein
MNRGYLREGQRNPAFCGSGCPSALAPLGCRRFDRPGRCDGVVNEGVIEVVSAVAAQARAKRSKKVTCEECFFARNGLCALELDEPCATFRPDHPDGLRPPTQMRFVFRQERRRQSAWAFPTAQEQARLHG